MKEFAAQSAYDRIQRQLTNLVSGFELQDSDALIQRAYDAICGRSLAFPVGARLSNFSRINHDGTPFQFATTVGSPVRSLQFLSEAGWMGLSAADRLCAGRECMASVASIFDVAAALVEAGDLLSLLAPENNSDLLIDPAGAFWIGAAFATSRNPQLRIYVNGSWGREEDRWTRLRRFASHFGALEMWMEVEKLLAPEMKPLGSALTFARDEPTSGRIYVSAYGKLIKYYEELAEATGGDGFADMVREFAECLLGEDIAYPTPTAVCSFGVAVGGSLDLKFELCGHCLFASDIDASDRLRSCFDAAGVDAVDYFHLLEVLSERALNDSATELHSYAGVGIRQGQRYFSVYLKPQLDESE
jgi:hypothetical protein